MCGAMVLSIRAQSEDHPMTIPDWLGEKRVEIADCEKRVVYTEVYSRIVGYLRPVSAWGKAKQQEFADRKVYRVPEGEDA